MTLIKDFFERGCISKRFEWGENKFKLLSFIFYYPRILCGFYWNDFGEKEFKLGINIHSDFDITVSECHVSFKSTLFGLGLGVVYQWGY